MNSEQETFDKLRRIDFEEVLSKYANIFRYLRMDMSLQELECIADPLLYDTGWTSKSILRELIKRRLLCR